jgi:hypothetical protein
MQSFAEAQPAKVAPLLAPSVGARPAGPLTRSKIAPGDFVAGGNEADVCRNRRSDFGQWISGRGGGA